MTGQDPNPSRVPDGDEPHKSLDETSAAESAGRPAGDTDHVRAGETDRVRESEPTRTYVVDPDDAQVAESTVAKRIVSDTVSLSQSAPPGDFIAGKDFGEYELIAEIARGGMGVVYQARQKKLNRIVALKMILAGEFADEQDVRRFHAEAEAAAQLQHPGIIPIYEVGEHAGRHYFSMAFVEGKTLTQLCENGPLDSRESAAMVSKIAKAVSYAHQHNVVHRDLKPSNVLLDEIGDPKVTDFGLAKRMDSDAELTGTGQILGTPGYMAPEQASANADAIGPPTDLYALGGILYFLLTGRPPFQAANVLDTLVQVRNEDPVSPRKLNPSIHRDLETICLKCLEKQPRSRYSSASALDDELQRFLNDQPIQARPIHALARGWRWCRRNRALATSLGLVVLLLMGLAIAGPLVALRESRRADTERTLRSEADRQSRRASQEWKRAENETRRANQMRGAAEEAADRAAEEANRARRLFYGADTSFAHEVRRNGNQDLFQRLLDRQRPIRMVDQDLRSFEWFYLRRLAANHESPEFTAFEEHTTTVTSVAFSPNGQLLATAGMDGKVILWDMRQAPRKLAELGAGQAAVTAIAFGPHGRLLAVASRSQKQRNPYEVAEVVVWDVLSGADQPQPYLAFGGYLTPVNTMVFSPDGSVLVTADGAAPNGGMVAYWDMTTGDLIKQFAGEINEIHALRFSPDGRMLALGGGWGRERGELRLLNAETGDVVHILQGVTQQVNSVGFSPDGGTLVSGEGIGNEPGFLRGWNVETGDLAWTRSEFVTGVGGIAYSADGERVFTAELGGGIQVWDADVLQPTLRLSHDAPLRAITLSPDCRLLVSAGAKSETGGSIRMWDASRVSESVQLHGHLEEPVQLAFHATADASQAEQQTERLVSLGRDESLRIWDVAAGKLIRQIDNVARGPIGFSIQKQPGHFIVVGLSGIDSTVRKWDFATGQQLEEVTLKRGLLPRLVRATQDGELLAVSRGEMMDSLVQSKGMTYDILLIQAESLEQRIAYSTSEVIRTFDLSPDGQYLAIATSAAMKQPINEVFSGLLKKPVRDHDELNAALRLVRVRDGKVIHELKEMPNPIGGIRFSPDGRRLAFREIPSIMFKPSGVQQAVVVYDIESWQETNRWEGKDAESLQIQFVDNKELIVLSKGHNLFRWSLDESEPTALRENVETKVNLAFSRDGTMLAGSGGENTIRLLDLTTGLSPTLQEPWPRWTPRGTMTVAQIQESNEVHRSQSPGPSPDDISARRVRAIAQQQAAERMKQIGGALRGHYQAQQRVGPPLAIRDKQGKPLLSWRVALLPYLGEQKLYDEFHLDEPWDSEHNIALLNRMPDPFRARGVDEEGQSRIHAVVGQDTFWSDTVSAKLSNVRDGASTICLVETDQATPWTQPREANLTDFDDWLDTLGLMPDAPGFYVLTLNGSAGMLRPQIERSILLAAATCNAGEPVGEQLQRSATSWSPNKRRQVRYFDQALGGGWTQATVFDPDPPLPLPLTASFASKVSQSKTLAIPAHLMEAFAKVSSSQRRIICSNSLKQLAIAKANYELVHQQLPAHVSDEDGRPLLSWRVLLLPYLGYSELYRRFHLDEPWDSEHNRKLLSEMPPVFAPVPNQDNASFLHRTGPPRVDSLPEEATQGKTYYQVITSSGGLFSAEYRVPLSFERVAEGRYSTRRRAEIQPTRLSKEEAHNRFAIVEAAQAVPWTQPEDLDLEGVSDQDIFSQFGGNGFPCTKSNGERIENAVHFYAAFANGSVRSISEKSEPMSFGGKTYDYTTTPAQLRQHIGMPPSREERQRRRIEELVRGARDLWERGDYDGASRLAQECLEIETEDEEAIGSQSRAWTMLIQSLRNSRGSQPTSEAVLEAKEWFERKLSQVTDNTRLKTERKRALDLEDAAAWRLIEPTELRSAAGAQLTLLPDKSILASGENASEEVYTLLFRIPAGKITALRLEVLPHKSLPNQGPGRHPTGNFQLTRFQASAAGSGTDSDVSLTFANAWASYQYSAPDVDVSATIRDNPEGKKWHVWGQFGQPHHAVFELATPWVTSQETTLEVRLSHAEFSPGITLGRFRLATTDHDSPWPESERDTSEGKSD